MAEVSYYSNNFNNRSPGKSSKLLESLNGGKTMQNLRSTDFGSKGLYRDT